MSTILYAIAGIITLVALAFLVTSIETLRKTRFNERIAKIWRSDTNTGNRNKNNPVLPGFLKDYPQVK